MNAVVAAQRQRGAQPKVTDPSTVICTTVTKGMWDKFCQLTAEGVKLDEALDYMEMSQNDYRRALRENDVAKEQLEAARHDYSMRQWPEQLIEDILVRVAGGEPLIEIADDWFFDPTSFRALRLRDPYIDDLYAKAKRMAAEVHVEELLTISDDDSNDMGMDAKGGDKPNTAAVQRARLRSDNRKWLASKLLKDVYGDHQIIEADVNTTINYAEKIEGARKRRSAGLEAAMREVGSGG